MICCVMYAVTQLTAQYVLDAQSKRMPHSMVGSRKKSGILNLERERERERERWR